MKYLGIDYGGKRVGVAVSDNTGSFAFPLVVLESSRDLILKIAEICAKNTIGEIVVGDSKDYSQKDNEIMKEIKPFAENLKKELKLPVHMHPEFLTSAEAERLQGKGEMHDASAAALILKSYLDTKNNSFRN
ncbi:MAG: Holliday junction resolvase RuvX [Minisyncoccia bacterium]